jgi:predicted nucleic acid-binding protein
LAGASEVISARQQGWLQVGQPENRSLVLQLQTSLDGGEAEAIGLAFELQAKLALIDETEGRAAAKALGLAVAGTLGVLV